MYMKNITLILALLCIPKDTSSHQVTQEESKRPAPQNACKDDNNFIFGWYNKPGNVRRNCKWITAGTDNQTGNRRRNWCNGRKFKGSPPIVDKCPEACQKKSCKPNVIPDNCFNFPFGWSDTDGDTCQGFYDNDNRCEKFGNGYINYGFTANNVCCKCGGGCLNEGGRDGSNQWTDENYRNCAWYGINQDRCKRPVKEGYNFRKACCACGGGKKRNPRFALNEDDDEGITMDA